MIETKTYEQILEENGTFCFKTVGFSMRPLIKEGRDVIVIQKPKEPYKKYDVILFNRPEINGRGAYVLHRILRVNNDGTYFVVGDNCYGGEIVKEENIVGILSSMIRKGKPISFNSFCYKVYVCLWCYLYPVRFLVLRVKVFLK